MEMISKVQVLDEMLKRIEKDEEYACILPYVG